MEDEPKPLFAATMASLEKNAPHAALGHGLPAAGNGVVAGRASALALSVADRRLARDPVDPGETNGSAGLATRGPQFQVAATIAPVKAPLPATVPGADAFDGGD